jgi:putative transposase
VHLAHVISRPFRANRFLGYLAEGAERYRAKMHCYVLMQNHFHLVTTTPEGNLSKWMHQLKTAHTIYFSRRHQVVGHLFQDRCKSMVIEAEKCLLEVSRCLLSIRCAERCWARLKISN